MDVEEVEKRERERRGRRGKKRGGCGVISRRENVVATMVDATVVGSGAQVHPG